MHNKEILLRKLKALAERGEAGERDIAAERLCAIMKKYGISEEALEDERRSLASFRYSNELERRLILQLAYAVTGKVPGQVINSETGRPRHRIGVECTTAEKIEISAKIDFYRPIIQAELEVFFEAFAMKHQLYPSEEKDELPKLEPDADRLKSARAAAAMATGMAEHDYYKQLPSAR